MYEKEVKSKKVFCWCRSHQCLIVDVRAKPRDLIGRHAMCVKPLTRTVKPLPARRGVGVWRIRVRVGLGYPMVTHGIPYSRASLGQLRASSQSRHITNRTPSCHVTVSISKAKHHQLLPKSNIKAWMLNIVWFVLNVDYLKYLSMSPWH